MKSIHRHRFPPIPTVPTPMRCNKVCKDNNGFIHITNEAVMLDEHATFLEAHKHEGINFGAAGGHIYYLIQDTNIRYFTSVHCAYCEESLGITNIDII